jgi:hypothetical protein
MPVVTYDVPLGDRPKYGTRAKFVEWLECHVGHTIEYTTFGGICVYIGEQTFDLHVNSYLEAMPTKWEYADSINKIVIIGGENWYIWQVKAETPRGDFAYAYQYAIYIKDTALAIQFKLSCL